MDKENIKSTDSAKKALIYTSHLKSLGGGAKAVLAIARAMEKFIPTQIASTVPISPYVKEWAQDLPLIPYKKGMEGQYEILWNVDAFSYAAPLAKRNLAFILLPHTGNKPPRPFDLFGVSDYASKQAEKMWKSPCKTLYLPIDTKALAIDKEKLILHVSRFVAPHPLADKGHAQMIQAFKTLQERGCDWQFVLIGSLEPGLGQYIDRLMELAQGYNIKFFTNANQETVNFYYAKAAIYWQCTGINMPEALGAQEHFGLSVVEGLAAGAVPVVLNTGGHKETLVPLHNGLLANNLEELIGHTKVLTENLNEWALMSQRAIVSGHAWRDQAAFQKRIQAVLDGTDIPKMNHLRWLVSAPSQETVCTVIPVHNQYQLTQSCLEKLWKHHPEVKIILVDNESTDETPSLKEGVESHGGVYIRREVNDGLAAAYMAAEPSCDRPFVLMMHNDVEAANDGKWLDVLLAEMMDEKVGVVGPKLIYPNSQLQFAGMGFTKAKGGRFYHAGYKQCDEPRYNQRQETFAVTGACLLCRKELFELDTDLIMKYEDIDLCFKAKEKGFKVIYQPGACLIHHNGMRRISLPGVEDKVLKSKEVFFKKYGQQLGLGVEA